jgi:flagellar motility protein MotE (MotC chaperone)
MEMIKTISWRGWGFFSSVLILGLCAKLGLTVILITPAHLLPWSGPRVSEAAIPDSPKEESGGAVARVMGLVEKERQALQAKESALALREDQLKVLRKEVEERLQELKAMQYNLRESLEEEKRLQGEHNRHLVATLEAMPPDRAGKLLEKMDDEAAVQLLRRLKGKEAGAILGMLPPDKAARLSHRLLK